MPECAGCPVAALVERLIIEIATATGTSVQYQWNAHLPERHDNDTGSD